MKASLHILMILLAASMVVGSNMRQTIQKEFLHEVRSKKSPSQIPEPQSLDVFRQRLKRNQVTFLEKPLKLQATGCREEWSLFGTECDIKPLTTFVTQESEWIKKHQNKIVQALQKFQIVISEALELNSIFRKANLKPVSYQKCYLDALASIDDAELRRVLDQIASGLANNSFRSCWQFTAALRSSAICSICSSRHSAFVRGDKMMITAQTCNLFIQKCTEPLTVMLEFLEQAARVAQAFKNRPDCESSDVLHKSMAFLNGFILMIKKVDFTKKIIEHLKKRDSEKSADPRTFFLERNKSLKGQECPSPCRNFHMISGLLCIFRNSTSRSSDW
jgi:hypothetical protein